jgi:hypothetical protein
MRPGCTGLVLGIFAIIAGLTLFFLLSFVPS